MVSRIQPHHSAVCQEPEWQMTTAAVQTPGRGAVESKKLTPSYRSFDPHTVV